MKRGAAHARAPALNFPRLLLHLVNAARRSARELERHVGGRAADAREVANGGGEVARVGRGAHSGRVARG